MTMMIVQKRREEDRQQCDVKQCDVERQDKNHFPKSNDKDDDYAFSVNNSPNDCNKNYNDNLTTVIKKNNF